MPTYVTKSSMYVTAMDADGYALRSQPSLLSAALILYPTMLPFQRNLAFYWMVLSIFSTKYILALAPVGYLIYLGPSRLK